MLPKFEDQLLDDLLLQHGPALDDMPSPAPSSPRRPLWLAAGGVGIAATGVDDANEELARLGIRATVVRVQPGCPHIWSVPGYPEELESPRTPQ